MAARQGDFHGNRIAAESRQRRRVAGAPAAGRVLPPGRHVRLARPRVHRNHGLLVVGRDVPEAFLNMYTFENACRIQIDALAGGTEVIHVDPRIMDNMEQVMKVVSSGAGPMIAWPALLRRLERTDPSYRT